MKPLFIKLLEIMYYVSTTEVPVVKDTSESIQSH